MNEQEATGLTEGRFLSVMAKADTDLVTELARRIHIEIIVLLASDLPNAQIRPLKQALEQAEKEAESLMKRLGMPPDVV